MKSLPETEFLLSLTDFGIKLGLEKTFNLLEKFGNPHCKYKSILVAGTNGKGSVAKSLSSVLCAQGYRTGLYTSPHLVDLRERIVFNNRPIPEEEFIKKIRQLQEILKQEPYHLYPTFFEAMTVLAFSFFADRGIDVLVCEVGMGGRFDATNVLPSFLEIITGIGLEHTKFLGKTYAEIANEKAGIIKQNSAVVTASQTEEAMRVIKSKAKERQAKLYSCGIDFKARRTGFSAEGQEFAFYGASIYHNLYTPLLGRYQIENMALVLQALILMRRRGFPVKRDAIYAGIRDVSWPCRFQILKKNPLFIIDGAHNPDGIRLFLDNLAHMFPEESFSFLMGILKDKNYKSMLHRVQRFKNIKEIVFTKPDTDRAAEPGQLASFITSKKIKISVVPDCKKAYRYTQSKAGNWCVCGSLYLCGNILPLASSSPVNRRHKKSNGF